MHPLRATLLYIRDQLRHQIVIHLMTDPLNFSLMVDHEHGGISQQPVSLFDSGSGIVKGSPVELVLLLRCESRGSVVRTANADELEGIVFVLLHERPPVFKHLDAGRSGRRPEFQHDDLAFEFVEIHRFAVEIGAGDDGSLQTGLEAVASNTAGRCTG